MTHDTEYLTPAEVAKLLKVCKNTVMRNFCDLPGVVDLGSPGTFRKSHKRVLRIPRSALNLFLAKRRAT
jgi:hypothetical protein